MGCGGHIAPGGRGGIREGHGSLPPPPPSPPPGSRRGRFGFPSAAPFLSLFFTPKKETLSSCPPPLQYLSIEKKTPPAFFFWFHLGRVMEGGYY